MLKLAKRKLYVVKATLRKLNEAFNGFKCGNYREEILNGNYVEGFDTNKGTKFSSLKSKYELILPTTVEESEWLV